VPADDRGSVYAQEGTALHEMQALALAKDIEPTTLLPFTFTSEREGWAFTVDRDLWEDKGEPALRAFDAFVCQEEKRLGEPMQFLIETRVQFPGIPNAFGTADIIARCGGEIFVLDWKFGRGIVPAEENKQLMFYACGALNTARDFFGGMTVVGDTPVTMVIIQPALSTGIDIWRTNARRLYAFKTELHEAIHTIQTQGMDAPIKDGPWCAFARCKSICPLHLGAAAKLAGRFEELQAAATGKKLPPNDMAGAVSRTLLDLADMVEDWAKEVRAQAHARAPSAAWRFRAGCWSRAAKGPRKWAIDEAAVLATFTGPEFGLEADAVAPRKVLTLPQLEKILKRIRQDRPRGLHDPVRTVHHPPRARGERHRGRWNRLRRRRGRWPRN
jgi:hypothetical protein